MPRNVDADCSEDANTIVYNVDDLKELVELNKDKRERAADEARELLAHEQASFEAWRDSLETVPTIKRLRGKAENIRAAELEKAMGKLGDGLTKKQMKAVEELSRGIVNKLLHGPMQALRGRHGPGAGVADPRQHARPGDDVRLEKPKRAPARAQGRRASAERSPPSRVRTRGGAGGVGEGRAQKRSARPGGHFCILAP